MSLHAELSPEAQERLKKQKRNSTIASALVSVAVIGVIVLVLGLFLLPNIIKENPTIITYAAQTLNEDTPEQKKVQKIQRKPSAPSASIAKVIATAAPSATSIPVPDIDVQSESVDFGSAQDFGTDWGKGEGFGTGGGGASFFNQSVSASRIAYVIDYSQSMRGKKDELMRAELTKSVNSLKPGTDFQMIFFAGAAWVSSSKALSQTKIEDKDGEIYEWTKDGGAHNFQPKGKLEEADWLAVSSSTMSDALEDIKSTSLLYGTDWRGPLNMALRMDPAPQLIFFMTDGASGGGMQEITDDIAKLAKKKGTTINTVAMMEPQAEKYMFELAEETGGVFTIVKADGTSEAVTKLKK